VGVCLGLWFGVLLPFRECVLVPILYYAFVFDVVVGNLLLLLISSKVVDGISPSAEDERDDIVY